MSNHCEKWALVTVQHSGTRFVMETLRPYFSTVGVPLTHSTTHYLYSVLYQHHCHPSVMQFLPARREQGVKLLTTVRDWGDVEKSWRRRYSTSRDLTPVLNCWRDHIEPNADCIITLNGSEDAQLAAFIEGLSNGDSNS